MIPALPALWKGILYDPEAMDAIDELYRGTTLQELDNMYAQACKDGLRGSCDRGSFLALAKQILDLANQGLQRQNSASGQDSDERIFLQPLVQTVHGS